jgi:multicomponent Na+:H+ antiporter subunit D
VKLAMLGAAALCIAIGVYPALLYSLLPNGGSGYQAYNPNTLLTTSIVLGAALLTFFTVGRKYLSPHETRLRDFDVGYVALGHGVMAFGGALQSAFGGIYGWITGRLVPSFSKLAGRMQTGLLSINGFFMLCALIIVLLVMAFWGL